MARTLKTRGLSEVQALLRRVSRQEGLRRIGEADAEYLKHRLKEVEAKIITMREFNEDGKEEG